MKHEINATYKFKKKKDTVKTNLEILLPLELKKTKFCIYC